MENIEMEYSIKLFYVHDKYGRKLFELAEYRYFEEDGYTLFFSGNLKFIRKIVRLIGYVEDLVEVYG